MYFKRRRCHLRVEITWSKRVRNFSYWAKKGWRYRDASVVHIRQDSNLSIGWIIWLSSVCIFSYMSFFCWCVGATIHAYVMYLGKRDVALLFNVIRIFFHSLKLPTHSFSSHVYMCVKSFLSHHLDLILTYCQFYLLDLLPS